MLIKEDKTNSALSMASKLNITSRAVEKNIKILREQGILVRHGAARGGYWEIKGIVKMNRRYLLWLH